MRAAYGARAATPRERGHVGGGAGARGKRLQGRPVCWSVASVAHHGPFDSGLLTQFQKAA